MRNEYIVWGIPKGKEDEEILYTKAASHIDAVRAIDKLTKIHGCSKCRVQEIDFSTPIDFANTINMR